MRRIRSSPNSPAYIADPDAGSLPEKQATARCGRVLHPYEGIWGALLDDVVCGRPAGHKNRCRSVQSLDAARERDRARWPLARERRRVRRAEKKKREELAAAVAEAAREARRRALGRLLYTQAHSLQIHLPSMRMISSPTRTQ